MKKYCIPLHLFGAFAFLYCFAALYFDTSVQTVYASYNIFMLPVFIGLTCLLYRNWNAFFALSSRRFLFILCGALFAVFFVFGTSLMLHGSVPFTSLFLWVSILLFTYVITAFLILLYTKALPALYHLLWEHSFPLLDKFMKKLSFPFLWLLIFLCWVPTLLACFPGIFSYDAIYQCSQVTDTLHLNAHHPIIHTLLLGGCVQFGRTMLGSANNGMLLYSIIQMLINSCIFAYILTFLKRHRLPSVVVLLCFAFFALIPFNSLFAVCATKDSLFASLFVLFFSLMLDLVTDTKGFFHSWKYMTGFSLVVFLLLTFRNNMLYAFVFCIPFLIWLYRSYWKKLLPMLLAPILLLLLYEGILYPALKVAPGSSREAYSVIMQQFGNVYNNCELESGDRKQLLALMDDEAWKKYEPHKSDAIKNEFRTDVFEENLLDYMKLWIKLGIRHPSQYLNAFFNLTYGYWYPNDVLPDTTTYRKYIEVYTGGDVTFDSKLPRLLEFWEDFGMESSYQKLPGLSMLFSPAFYLWILLFLSTVSIYTGQYKFLTALLPPAALFLTLLLGPVALLRYLYPIILCTPVICAVYANDSHSAKAL